MRRLVRIAVPLTLAAAIALSGCSDTVKEGTAPTGQTDSTKLSAKGVFPISSEKKTLNVLMQQVHG
jgi:hypothetical protein